MRISDWSSDVCSSDREILVNQAHSKERFNRLTAMTWLLEFIALGGDNLLKYLADILRAVMHCISDQEPEIRQVADETNQALLSQVQATKQAVDQERKNVV